MWVKYWSTWAWGASTPEWTFLGTRTLARAEEFVREEMVPDWDAEYDYSDKYRGTKFELHSTAPKVIVQQKYDELQEKLAYTNKVLALLQTELTKE